MSFGEGCRTILGGIRRDLQFRENPYMQLRNIEELSCSGMLFVGVPHLSRCLGAHEVQESRLSAAVQTK